MSKKSESIAVLVTTTYRGVFFGYSDGVVSPDKRISLTKARNCLYWSSDVKGFLGLAVTGPSSSCKVGPAVDSLELLDVTSVAKVTPEAVKKWEKHPWSL